MILKALYDYYNRCDNLPVLGMEEKQIGFLLVIDKEGRFIRFEDCRIDKNTAKSFLVKKSVGRSSAPVANYLYDNSAYVLGFSGKDNGKDQLYFDTFKEKIQSIANSFPNSSELKSLISFYDHTKEELLASFEADPLWEDIKKNLSKKYSVFSFRIDGDTKIVAEKRDLLPLNESDNTESNAKLCLITGESATTVETTTATMIPGSQATAKLVAFQIKSGYDSYGKEKGGNAPISEKAEFAYTTALNTLLARDSRNKFMIGGRTFLFWASSNSETCKKAEESLFDFLGFTDAENDDPNAKIEQVRKVFKSIYFGSLHTTSDDKFYILGLAPNSARIAVVYWSETTLKEFAGMIVRHFGDMGIVDSRQKKRPYAGLKDMLGAVTLGGKHTDATPNLPDAVVKSIFQGLPYPQTLFASAIRRIRAEQDVSPYGNPCRVAILKAYLNRSNNNNNKKIEIMLDKENTNQGYLCGRLFATLEKIQEDANKINSVRERYMNAASATPAAVFATLLNLSVHHTEKLNEGRQIFYEKLKQEIVNKIIDFPSHLDLQDQGRFFVGYYHQRQDFFTSKEAKEVSDNEKTQNKD